MIAGPMNFPMQRMIFGGCEFFLLNAKNGKPRKKKVTANMMKVAENK